MFARMCAGVGVAAALAMGPAAAWAKTAAIVLDVQGPTTPAVSAAQELQGDQTIELTDQTRLTFVHLDSCKMVTVVGGTVRLQEKRYMISGGEIERERKRCPAQVQVAAAGESSAGGVVYRNFAQVAVFAVRPSIMIAGAKAMSITQATVKQGNQTVATLPVSGARIAWPAAQPALNAEQEYELVLSTSDGKTISQKFRTADSNDSADPAGLVYAQ
ncbi:hypothetical protein [Zavarzinia sp. CC-PAN008]|uniref:hypothetical protein n=1 Tax=Zavarzinia sp. CC-PAN008 TaxID=3243332 RepID=UPI003F745D26